MEVRLRRARSPLAGGGKILAYNASWLKTFYQRRSFLPAWTSGGKLHGEVRELAAALRNADLEGLDPGDYSSCAIESIWESNDQSMALDDATAAAVDVLLTDSYLRYASDLSSGRVEPGVVNAEWDLHPNRPDLARALQQAFDSVGIGRSLELFCCRSKEYRDLRKALAFFRSLPAGQEADRITGVRRLAKGDSSCKVIALRKRVAPWSPGLAMGSPVFDLPLEDAVKAFQRHFGIDPDGVVGKATIAALNRTRADFIQQIIVNLERHRWLPDTPEGRHIDVNIPGFELSVMENGVTVRNMRVVVGKSDHRTPLLCNPMTYLVFSPFWNVPRTIASRELIPEVIKNVSYLKKEKIRVFEKDGDDLSEVDPESVDWTDARGKNLRFRMEPGAKNSLGRIKFMFPNCKDVYLHDTPVKSLFGKCDRSFSHGCVRIEEPISLAAYLLSKDTSWVKDEIRKASSHHGEHVVRLPEQVPVRLQYFTAWVDKAGSLQFRKDIYGWDDQVAKALRGIPVPRKTNGPRHFAASVGPGVTSPSME